jgi:hypothetical protein
MLWQILRGELLHYTRYRQNMQTTASLEQLSAVRSSTHPLVIVGSQAEISKNTIGVEYKVLSFILRLAFG